MKIAVVCANDRARQLITKETLQRGLDITADDLKAFDVVIDAFGAWTQEELPLRSTSLNVLCDALSETDTRLLVVGGAGNLYVNPEHTACVADGPDFLDLFKPLAAAMAKALSGLRQRNVVKWTYSSRGFPDGRWAQRSLSPWRRGADAE